MTINIKGQLYDFHTPWVMGILNVTPDSFFSSSRMQSEDTILRQVTKMMDDGADVIDVGGYSSRPGAEDVTSEEEYSRIALALNIIRKNYPDAIISVDTFRAIVAQRAVEEFEADIINDISGGDLDANMWTTIAKLQIPYVIMHMRGTPQTMQSIIKYDDITADVIKSLAFKVAGLHNLGVNDIIIDPGFGFAKTLDDNYALLAELKELKRIDVPMLVGISRKSMIYKALSCAPDDALNGTTVLNTIALLGGADILRVHDVKEAKETVKLVQLMKENLKHQ